MTEKTNSNAESANTAIADKVLVVDDESDIRVLVEYHLKRAGYNVLVAEGGKQAIEIARKENPVVALLDRMMPEMDGVEVCRQLRQINPSMFIMMLTALDTEDQKILGLEAGADDYVTKPFSGRELVARVNAMMRRNKIQAEIISVPKATEAPSQTGLIIDSERRQVWKNGQELDLTKLEFDLLKYLHDHPGLVFSRDQLLEQIWNYDYFGDGRVVDVHLARLRKKLEEDPSNPRYVQTIRGVGYKFSNKP
ncbi:MAG: response regulator transcription factor [Chloroflexi bacterium]|uniref:Response regulator transcription factor n=1 Tax=Candidatus Chlorohelix allophototropha TaxID=3003348 RepID=A0A8T7LZV7_9CHLR|nr:response regulator transcription factor [Chloroflexota bacterium]WJW66861.1 response regulator transcription factor [Chloroflexota bacterium L227-S17]